MSDEAGGRHTRPSLLIRLRNPEDQDAWDSFVRLYGRLLLADGRRRGLNNADAEDVTQEVFARVVRAIRTFEYQPERGRFRDWLGAIMRNEVLRFLGKRRAQAVATDGDLLHEVASSDTGWNELFQQHVLAEALRVCQPQFAPHTWQAFERVWVQNRAPVEVAGELQMSLDNVYLAKSRVLKRLMETVRLLSDDLPSLS